MTSDTNAPASQSRLQAALDASEARFRSLVEGAPDGIVISRAATVLYANPAAARMLGYDSPADLVGLHMSAFLDPAELRSMALRLQAPPREGGRALAPFEYRAIRRDGSSVTAEITSLPIDYEGGPAVVAIARDVTERVRMHAQLAHADRLAAIGTLAAGVAHEINNPLSYVGLGLQALERHVATSLPEQTARTRALELIREISGGAQRVAGIVRDLRAFARRDADEAGPVDLREVLHAVERMTAREVSKHARLSIEVGQTGVFGNPARLEQVFINLVLNAAQAIASDELGHVWITTGVRGDWVTVEVRDDGSGIAPEHLPRIFDPFFTTKPTGMGTGLGLSVCLGIVRAFGGDIEVDTKAGPATSGRGTTFRVLLRATALSATTTPSTPAVATVGREPVRSRVLIVDDEPVIGRMLANLLGASHDVTVAASGDEGLAAMGKQSYDVVVCDLLMPGMTGMELYDRVAAEHPDAAKRIVLMTGGAFTTEAQRFLARSTNRCLHKPFSLRELEAAMSEVQGGVEGRRDANADG